jgi:gliding motility-associated-like protein
MQIFLKISQTYLKSKYSSRLFIILIFGLINNNFSTLSADELRSHPNAIVFNAVEGHPLSDTRSIFLTTTDSTVLGWSETANVPWLVPDANNGVTDGVLKIGINTSGLTAGVHNANITIYSPEATNDPVNISVTLVINPDVPVKITPWKDGRDAAMSVSVDDSKGSGFTELQANGFQGTYYLENIYPQQFYTDYYYAGMELGSHTVNHNCFSVTDDVFRTLEIVPNIAALCNKTAQPCKDVISLAWPCGYTNYREQADAADYFLSARGYNINKLEDPYPENFMNLKSYNSHEHYPYPPSDLKTVVDLAVSQKKWFNLVLHDYTNEDGAINYAATKNIWVTSIGTVIKYILQREGFILTDYVENVAEISYKVSRLSVPATPVRPFENAFGPNDVTTMQIDIDDSKIVDNVYIDGVINAYQTKDISGNIVLLTNVKLDPAGDKTVEIKYKVSGINLTISGVTAINRVYNGTTTASLNTTGATLVGVLNGDDVTLISTGATGYFTNKNAGTAKTVITSGFTLTGTDAAKYSLTQPTTTASITTVPLTITGISANNRVYNGTTGATLNKGSATLVGVIAGDLVSIVSTAATGSFANKNVGVNKTVSTAGFTLGGVDAGNYTLTQPTTYANITSAPLTISGVTANNKVYNGTTAATLVTGSAALSGIFGTDVVTLSTTGVTGTFANKNAGTSKTVVTSGFTIGGTDSGNYTLTQPTATANITAITLTVSGVTANNKVYNGTTAATLNTGSATLSGVLGGESVTLVSTAATGTFVNKNTGTAKAVSTSGFTPGGTDSGNYVVTQPATTGNITPAPLTVSGVTANNKAYDGTTGATINTGSAALVGLFGADVVTIGSAGVTGVYENPDIGTAKMVIIAGFTIGGTDSGNYTLTQPTATANITSLALTVTGVTANNKVYDGTTAAVINTGGAALAGVLGSDIVTVVSTGATGTFINKNAGSAKAISTSGFTLSGPDAGKYTLIQPSATASITTAALTVSGVTANTKVYNGTTVATLNTGGAILSGVKGTDVVNLVSAGAAGTFATRNAGISIAVSVASLTLGGTDAANYTLTQPATTGSITQAPLTIAGVTANNKVYDGTTSATINAGSASLTGIFGTDNVILNSVNCKGTFTDQYVGTGKPVLLSGSSIQGTDAPNYVLTGSYSTADITAKTLRITANDISKFYRTTFTFTGTEYSAEGLITGDNPPDVSLSSPGAAESAAAGTYIISISGGINKNYDIIYVDGKMTVGKFEIVVTADNITKVYGSENPPLSFTYSGFINGDDASVIDVLPVASTTATTTSDADTYPISFTNGTDDNYDFIYNEGTLTVNKADQVITFGQLPHNLRMTQEYELRATASSGLPVSYESSDPETASIEGNLLTVHQDGNITIKASQLGDNNWNAAKDEFQDTETLPTFDNISSLFTPNADGMNDYWYISGMEKYGKIQVTVYNRFGKAVYKSDNYNNDWDGTWNGTPLPSAAYYYIIKSSVKGYIKGVVNIVR